MTHDRPYNTLRPVPASLLRDADGSMRPIPRSSARYAVIIFQEDASGWQTFSYGKLGELTENIRTFALPFEQQTYTFAMKYTYDSWNRILKMSYPDGEVVSYRYNLGGMLKSVHGNKDNVAYRYIDSICYNQFELKDSVFYGNGSRVSYEYDSLQRLSRLCSWTAGGDTMQKIAYTYDSVSNITGIHNTAPMLTNGLGNPYFSQYVYDNLYRLTRADGWWYGESMSYQVQMAYYSNGRILRKCVNAPVYTQTATSNSLSTVQYDNYYHYNSLQPNTLFDIDGSDQQFEWNAQGNMTRHTNGSNERYLCWDEQNRLMGVKDNYYLSFYQYDANGDRTYKLTGKGALQNISGDWQHYYLLDNATLYASPYLVATEKGYTKHYYAETERIASRIGGGNLQGLDHLVVGQEKILLKKEQNNNHAEDVLGDCLNARWYDVGTRIVNLYDWVDSVQPEDESYWYHPDHLGSSSWITDKCGHAIQHLHYLPWGEDMVNQQLTGFGASFTFSAKERDPETGLSYFGSRYYSSDLSIWLSVDPMSGKYPSLSPYVYCADNPVRVVDPDGEKIRIYYGNSKKKYIKYTPGMKVRKRYDPFVKDVITGLNFLYDHPEGDKNRVGFLAGSEIILDIYQQTTVGKPSTYSGERRELFWDNKHIDIYAEGSQSPVVGLAHEIDHADRSIDAWEKLYACEDAKGSNCDDYVERAYSRDEEEAENSAMDYENFIGRQLHKGKRVSSYQRKEYIPPIEQIEAETIFSIAE